MNPATRFPPSFDGNPFSYGFALFSLTLISAVAITILANYFFEGRARDEIDKRIGNYVRRGPGLSTLSPLLLHRRIISGLLLTVVFGALPNVVLLLSWGEAADTTIGAIFLVDRFFDGLTAVPFTYAIVLLLWGQQAFDHRLSFDATPISERPPWAVIRERSRLVLVILLISIGVTLAKYMA